MNKFKEEADNDVCIRDLKQLGKEGGATAYLDNGQIVKLKAKYGTISKKGYIAGRPMKLELKVEYKDIFISIRTIERHGVLIARRCRYGSKKVLKLTGRGFHRCKKSMEDRKMTVGQDRRKSMNLASRPIKDNNVPVSFDIVEHIAILSENESGWKKELNKVSWNGTQPKFDIRSWNSDYTKAGKGITIFEDEMIILMNSIKKLNLTESNKED